MIYGLVAILSILCAGLFALVIKQSQRIGILSSSVKTMGKLNDSLKVQAKIAARPPRDPAALIGLMRDKGL